MNPLLKLIDLGQSYWIDNLTRKMIQSGELKRRITEEGLRGMTSNPAIFNKAISKSSDYNEQIRQLLHHGSDTAKIFEALAIKDVQDACDLFRPVYDSSQGVDGFVSLEVSPYLARHTEATIEEARRLYKAVNRPNCFIKIPGTLEGLPAIEQMLCEGVNVNVTLLFAVKRYEAVAKTYIKALERRAAEGRDVTRVASVASFFISRMDVLVDQLLSHHLLPEDPAGAASLPKQLMGKMAVANARMAYQSFKKIFSTPRWKKLEKKGAKVQRPLWASTSTKTPGYNDVMYVEPLIGENTVNTMPEETITAFADHGQLQSRSVEKNLAEARNDLRLLKKLGIQLDFVTQQLENEGIQKFIDPFIELMKSINAKQKEFSSAT
ncbi:MAG: transaldolase [Caldithrix sp. RBG_13_44_9]|nr:MAG: transaldolase [Caldithrix sp. RBG_13_44_9]